MSKSQEWQGFSVKHLQVSINNVITADCSTGINITNIDDDISWKAFTKSIIIAENECLIPQYLTTIANWYLCFRPTLTESG